MKKLRVLALMHEDLVPPEDSKDLSRQEMLDCKMEFDVLGALRNMGHEVLPLGVRDDLSPIRKAVSYWKPDIAFNLLEEFHGVTLYDQHVAAYLELLQLPYTGCNPRGLMLAHDKVLSKKLLAYHRIPVPDFILYPRGKTVRRPRRLDFPLLVKSATEEASLGISQASVVTNDDKLKDRVAFLHEQLGTDVLVEEYIEGRELYVGVMGHRRLKTLPVWEMLFTKLPEGVPKIATAKVKWDLSYQEKSGIVTRSAKNLPAGVEERLPRLCRRIYRILELGGYARLDFRLADDGRLFVLEANPNPNLSQDEDFAESAALAGLTYEKLIERILVLGLKYLPKGLQPA